MTSPRPAIPSTSAEEDLSARLEGSRTFAAQLTRGLKLVGLHRHNEARFGEFLRPAHEALTALLEETGSLVLTVESDNFAVAGTPVFGEPTQLAYRFYRDGIRQLIFREGFTGEELVTFCLIASAEAERGGGADLVTQLWQADLPHFEYVAVEGFTIDGVAEREVDAEVDQIVDYLYQRLRSHSEDYLRFAKVAAADLDTKFDGIEQVRGLVVSGVTASQALKVKLQREIEEEEKRRLFPKLVAGVLQLLEAGLRDQELMLEVLVQLVDALLLQESFGTIQNLLVKLGELAARDKEGKLTLLRDALKGKLGEEHRVTRVAEVLKVGRPKEAAEIRAYLDLLDARSITPLLSALETVEAAESRALICDVLVRFAPAMPEPFLVRLESDRPQTVRDMLSILDRAGYRDRMKLFASVLFHPNLTMRLEVMQIIARGDPREARRLLSPLLNDDAPPVRVLAARLLPSVGPEDAYADLMRVIRGPEFERKADDERIAFYSAVGATGIPVASALLSSLLEARGNFLTRRRVLEEKLLAIHGLVAMRNARALELLQQASEDPDQPEEVRGAARRAFGSLQRVLGSAAEKGDRS